MPPAKPIAASAVLAAEAERHRRALKIQVRQETPAASTPTLSLNTLGSAWAISRVPSGTPARPPIRNGQTSLKSIDRQIARHGRGLRNDRTDQHQRHRDGGRQHIKPDPQRHQRGAETGEAGDETAGQRAEEEKHQGERIHQCFRFLLSFRGVRSTNPKSEDSGVIVHSHRAPECFLNWQATFTSSDGAVISQIDFGATPNKEKHHGKVKPFSSVTAHGPRDGHGRRCIP